MKSVNGSIDIINTVAKRNLSESHQDVNIKFAFARVDKENQNRIIAHQWVLCRDFMTDAILASRTKKTYTVFGFQAPDTIKLDLRNTRYLMKFPNQIILDRFQSNVLIGLPVFNKYFNQVPKTKLKLINQSKLIVEVVASKQWQRMPQLISYHTQFMRLLANSQPTIGTELSEIWEKWRIQEPERRHDVDCERITSVPKPRLNNLHHCIQNYLTYLQTHPRAKTLPEVSNSDNDDVDEDDNRYKIDLGTYHDSSGWFHLATCFNIGNSMDEFYKQYVGWDQF